MKKLKLFAVLAAVIVFAASAVVLPTNVVEAHTRTVNIKVDKNGFSPSSIEVEAGHKLNLVFNRADDAKCGTTVVFRKLNIRKALPAGKDVIVSITPREVGQITFTCGVYKGNIVVSEG